MSDPKEILERRLKAVLNNNAATRGLHFFCQLGGYNQDLGIITFQVSGSGQALLSWRHSPDDVDLWTLQFTEQDYHQFIRLFMTYPFWTVTPPRRTREEGEINVHIRVSAQDVGTYQGIQFWSGHLDDYRVLRKLVTPLCKLMQNISYETITDEDLQQLIYE